MAACATQSLSFTALKAPARGRTSSRSRASVRVSAAGPKGIVGDGKVSICTSKGEFEAQQTAAGDNLVAVQISTKTCGPCKVVYPHFAGLSEELPDVKFCKIKGNHKAGEVQGQTRQHARLINLLGVKQLIVGINKMDCDTAGYKESRYEEIRNEMKNMLIKVGWKKDYVEKCVPVLPISGWIGDNLIKKTSNMAWWTGMDVIDYEMKGVKSHIDCLLDVLNGMVNKPERKSDCDMRLPISGVYKIKGVGDVLAGRVEQGEVRPGEEVIFIPTHTVSNPCTGKVFTVEMHHKRVDAAHPGDNVGMNIKGLDKINMPRTGDVMIYKKDTTLKAAENFNAQVQILDVPGQLKPGYSPVAFVRCARSACKMTTLIFKVGKETGGKKLESPQALKSNEVAEAVFEPCHPFVVDTFKSCEGLSRIAFLDGNTAVMLGKITKVTFKADK